ncbi:unnamed protein product [Allacma fusca]|uniref:Uncharacterized protein n=1 Tax=Allacma fusca TaxID=39272 RepID=A0A8J2NMJ5_9HEXA|nr:unnamed protein product [Allacma fusca]
MGAKCEETILVARGLQRWQEEKQRFWDDQGIELGGKNSKAAKLTRVNEDTGRSSTEPTTFTGFTGTLPPALSVTLHSIYTLQPPVLLHSGQEYAGIIFLTQTKAYCNIFVKSFLLPTKAGHNYPSYTPVMSHTAPHPYGSKNPHAAVIPSVNSTSKDTLFVFLTLAFISVTLYFTFFLWRKHRERPLATLYKLEEYRYSRLSQNELEVDSVVFYGDTLVPEVSQNSDEDEECKPATLHLETDSLIAIPNGKSTVTADSKTPTQKPPPSQTQNQSNQYRTSNLILQDSDEDLLQ